MSEPTPLSAERALNLLRLSARVDPLLRQAVADVEVHIDAQATEIAALRAVASQQQQRAQLAEGKLEGYRQALRKAEWIAKSVAHSDELESLEARNEQ